MRRVQKYGKQSVAVVLLLFLFSFAFQGPALGEEKSDQAPGLITMNFKDVDLGVLIKFISDLTQKNFVVDPAVKGRVTILSPRKVSVGEAYKVFLSVLEVNGFTAVPAGQVVKIIKASEAKGKGVETFFGKGTRAPTDRIITQLYPLRYADSSNLAKLLKPLVPRTGLLIPYAETNTLIIIDVFSNIERLLRIIRQLDVEGVEETAIFMLQYARAEKLVPKLKEIFLQKRGRKLMRSRVKMISDERTNALIVVAPPKIMADIRMLVGRLDQKEAKPRATIHIYSLQNAVAEDLVKVLSQIPGKGAEKKKGGAPLVSKNVQISADKATNTLVIIAEPDEYHVLKQIIEKLDIPRTMVYVEALIVEVSTDKALELGVEWRAGNTYNGGYGEGSRGGVWVGGTAGSQGGLNALSTGSLPAGFAAGVVGRAVTLGSVTFPTLGAFIKAVRTDSDFNIISTPQILTLDNEEAVIEVGKTIPFVTRIDQGTSTTDRAIQSFEYKDVGVTLKVTPQINSQDLVRLNLEESVKTVLETTALGGTVLAPTTAFRSAKTTITVRDGETAVIGGLIEKQMNRGKTQVPCLGGLPFMGWLFKTTSDRDIKTNLLVFLTPHIVKNEGTAKDLYKKKRGLIDREQMKADKREQSEILRQKGFR
ncbi:MAG: type II secretion system secretin GspD [Deltaproteobacteria bacterium]|nr:type II secretion system secretin GspD [Deltaproteobacteria bacterium]